MGTTRYTATGRKLTQSRPGETRQYLGGIEYLNGILEAFPHGHGRVVNLNGTSQSSFRYEYNLTDHLGNVRIVFSDLDNDGRIEQTNSTTTNEVLQENHYYPFGMNFGGSWAGVAGGNRYRYNGKEFNEDLGLYDYGARWYDPAIARWTSVDPLAEKMVSWSSYNYVFGNPISLVDPDGRKPKKRRARNEKREQRRKERANRKFRQKIEQPLNAFWTRIVASSELITVEDAESQLRPEANRLAKKYRKKRWMWGGSKLPTSGKKGRTKATGQKGKVIPTILLVEAATIASFTDGKNALSGLPNLQFDETVVFSTPEGLSQIQINTGQFTVSFDGDNHPDNLTVSLTDGTTLMSGNFGATDGEGSYNGTQRYLGRFSGQDTGGAINLKVSRPPDIPVQDSRYVLSVNFAYLNIRRSTSISDGVKNN